MISTFSSVFSFPFNILNGILTAYGKYVYSKIATIIGKVFVTIFTVLVLSMDWGLHAFVIVHALESVLNVGYKYYVVRKHTGAKLQLSFYDKNLAKDIIRFAMWITIMAISHRLIFTVVPSILGIVSNTTEAARFGVVLTIENYLYIISTAFSGMFMPTVSRIYNESDFENKLVELVVKICKLIYGINVLIFVGLLFLGGDFLRLWAGNEYEAVHLGLLMVVFPTMFYNTAEVLNTAVMVKNKVKYSALINFAAGILNVLCCFTASRYWGANGACLSIMIATSLRTVLTYVLYQKVLHISVKTVIIESYVKTLPAVLVTAGFGILGKIFVLNSGWIGFVLKGIALVAGAAVGTLLFMRKDLFPDHRK